MTLRFALVAAVALTALATMPVAGPAAAAPAAKAKAPAASKAKTGAHPDLTGTWDNGNGVPFTDGAKDAKGNICVLNCGRERTADEKAMVANTMAPEVIPYKPELVAKVAELRKTQVTNDPALRCGNPGVPRIGMPDQIIQTPTRTIFLYDDLSGSFWRIVPTNTRKHREDSEQSLLGDSIGWWEGDTFVVESVNFDDSSWLTDNGAFHSDKMKVTERFRRDGKKLYYEAFIDDPEVLTKVWAKRPRFAVLTDSDLLEPPPCVEQSIANMKDLSDFHSNPR
jgi:hypothetical protein